MKFERNGKENDDDGKFLRAVSKKETGKVLLWRFFMFHFFDLVRQSPFRSARRFKTRFLKMFFWGNGRVMGL